MAKALIQDVVLRMKKNTGTAAAAEKPTDQAIPDANSCAICGGVGYVRQDLPVGHPDFGKVQPCVCQKKTLPAFVYFAHINRLQFDAFQKMTFSTFKPRSTVQAKALKEASDYAQGLDGWLLLEGERYCGKTHLAAAVCNQVAAFVPCLFLTAVEFIQQLDLASKIGGATVEMLDEARNAKLLVLDGYGEHQVTALSQEKMFQVINARYINRLPTIVTTRRSLDDFNGRIRSRLMDDNLVRHVNLRMPR